MVICDISSIVARTVYSAIARVWNPHWNNKLQLTDYCSAFSLEVTSKSFALQKQVLFSLLIIESDNQLAIIGIFNKIMDYLIGGCLTHIADTLLTRWMTSSSTVEGVATLGFELEDELKKPWITIWNLHERWKRLGWEGVGWVGMLRYFTSFAVAVCVLLLGASINTVRLPRERWVPDTRYYQHDHSGLILETRQVHIQSVNYMNWWSQGWNMIRLGGDPSWGACSHSNSCKCIFRTFQPLRHHQSPSHE